MGALVFVSNYGSGSTTEVGKEHQNVTQWDATQEMHDCLREKLC